MSMKVHTLFRNALSARALLVLTLTGCTNEKELTTPDKGAGKQITLTATTGHARTRLTYEDQNSTGIDVGISVNWKAGDQFILYREQDYNVPGEIFTTDEDGIRGSANFTGTLPVGEIKGGYYACYPASRFGKLANNSVYSVLGQVQRGATSTVHLSEYNYMEAFWDGTTETIKFGHASAILKFIVRLPTGAYPRTLTLSTQDNSYLCVASPRAGSSSAEAKQLVMTITGEDGNDAGFSEFTAYMSVIYSIIESGSPLAVAVTCTNGRIYNYKVDSLEEDTVYEPGNVYDAVLTEDKLSEISSDAVFDDNVQASGELSSSGTSENGPFIITSAEDLKLFADSDTYKSGSVKLTTDIHITADTWTPITGFTGTFDGGGHTISGKMAVSSGNHLGFFQELKGSVSNLHISADLEYRGTSDIYMGAIASCLEAEQVSPIRISHCTFTGRIIFTQSDIQGTIRIGGIAGQCDGYCTIECCTSTANIELEQLTGGITYLGGIVGYLTKNDNIYHCINTGNISTGSLFADDTDIYAGGIVGQIGDDSSIQFCRNKGAVSLGSGKQRAGGIAGCANHRTVIHTSHNENKNISVTSEDRFVGSLCGVIGGDHTYIYDCCTGPTSDTLSLIGGGDQIIPDYQDGHMIF